MNKDEEVKLLKIQTWVLKVNIHCDGCKLKVKKLLHKIDGVYTTVVDAEKGIVTVSGDVDGETLLKKLNKAGKPAELLSPKPPTNGQNLGQLAGQFQKLQLGKGGNHTPNKPKGQPPPAKNFKDIAFPPLKDITKMPPGKPQKSVRFDEPSDDDDDFDDEFDDEFDDGFDDGFEDDVKPPKPKPFPPGGKKTAAPVKKPPPPKSAPVNAGKVNGKNNGKPAGQTGMMSQMGMMPRGGHVAAAAPPGFYGGVTAEMLAAANPYAQQQIMAAMMQQRMAMGGPDRTCQPMMPYVPRGPPPPPPVGYFAAPPPPPPEYTHMFSDENTHSCHVM